MESDAAFQAFGREIASDPIGVLLAKWRRDEFIADLKRLPDVVEVIPSGSLARGTQIGPVHDVDLIVVFDSSAHPDYGRTSASAQAAMDHLERGLLEQRHPWTGPDRLLQETEQRRHVVTCSGGVLGRYQDFIPSAPPVDVMPAVRQGGHLRVPEDGDHWIDVDPEKFMHLVAERQREWEYFTEVIKMVRAWAEFNNLEIKTVAIEAMVLRYCPRPRFFQTLSCGEALAQFFENAAKDHITRLTDPAGRCGEIDPHMNYSALRTALGKAATLARRAVDAERADGNWLYAAENPTDPSEFWRKLFGREYPKAKKRFWHPQDYEPWFTRAQAEPAAETNPRPHAPPRPGQSDSPNPPDPDDPPRPDGSGGREPRPPNQPPAGGAPDRRSRRPAPDGPGTGPSPGPRTGPWPDVFGPGAGPTVPLTFG